jgi:hypothetical protein
VWAGTILSEGGGGRLRGMSTVAWIGVGLACTLPVGLAVIEPWLRRVEKERGAAEPLPTAPPVA